MNDTFLKDHVYMNIPKKYSQELEELIGDINNVLESKIGMRICYDKNDKHMEYLFKTKSKEDCFSGFAILRDDQNETNNKNTWGYIYGDECDELWEHFDLANRDKNDRMKVKFIEYQTEEEINEKN